METYDYIVIGLLITYGLAGVRYVYWLRSRRKQSRPRDEALIERVTYKSFWDIPRHALNMVILTLILSGVVFGPWLIDLLRQSDSQFWKDLLLSISGILTILLTAMNDKRYRKLEKLLSALHTIHRDYLPEIELERGDLIKRFLNPNLSGRLGMILLSFHIACLILLYIFLSIWAIKRSIAGNTTIFLCAFLLLATGIRTAFDINRIVDKKATKNTESQDEAGPSDKTPTLGAILLFPIDMISVPLLVINIPLLAIMRKVTAALSFSIMSVYTGLRISFGLLVIMPLLWIVRSILRRGARKSITIVSWCITAAIIVVRWL